MNPTLKAYLDKLHAETRAQYAEIHKQLQLQEALFSKFDTGASTSQSAGSAVVTSDGGLNVDATTVAAVPDVSSSTTKALEVLPDASLDSIDPMPVTCSTDCSNQVVATAVCSEPAVDLNDHEVEQLAPARAMPSIGTGTSSITEEVAPSVVATTDVDPKAGVQATTDAFSRLVSSMTCEAYHLVDPSGLAALALTTSWLVLRPKLWPSFWRDDAEGTEVRPIPWPSFSMGRFLGHPYTLNMWPPWVTYKEIYLVAIYTAARCLEFKRSTLHCLGISLVDKVLIVNELQLSSTQHGMGLRFLLPKPPWPFPIPTTSYLLYELVCCRDISSQLIGGENSSIAVSTKACSLLLDNICLKCHIIHGEMNSKILQQSGILCVQPTNSVRAYMKLDEFCVAAVCMFEQGTSQDWGLMLCFKQRPPLVYKTQVHWKLSEKVACWIPMMPSYIPVLSQLIMPFMHDLTWGTAEWRLVILSVQSSYEFRAQDAQPMFGFSQKKAQLKLPGSYFFCNCQAVQFLVVHDHVTELAGSCSLAKNLSQEKFKGSDHALISFHIEFSTTNMVLLSRDTTQLQSWPPPPSKQGTVPVHEKILWFHSWLGLLLFGDDSSLEALFGCHITRTRLMDKHMGLPPGGDTGYANWFHWKVNKKFCTNILDSENIPSNLQSVSVINITAVADSAVHPSLGIPSRESIWEEFLAGGATMPFPAAILVSCAVYSGHESMMLHLNQRPSLAYLKTADSSQTNLCNYTVHINDSMQRWVLGISASIRADAWINSRFNETNGRTTDTATHAGCLIYLDFSKYGLLVLQAAPKEQVNCQGQQSYACYILQLMAGAEYFAHWDIIYEFYREGCKCVIWMPLNNEESSISTVIQHVSICFHGFASSRLMIHPANDFSYRMSSATTVKSVAKFGALMGKLPRISFYLPLVQPKHPWPFPIAAVSTQQLLFHMKTITEFVTILKIYSRLFQAGIPPLLGSQSASACHLEQFWDPGPGNNTLSVWIPHSLEYITHCRGMLSDGQNSVMSWSSLLAASKILFKKGGVSSSLLLSFAQDFADLEYYPGFDCGCADNGYVLDWISIHHNYYFYLVEVYSHFDYHRDSDNIQEHRVHWDPGGCQWFRLGVKPNFKKGGMLGASYILLGTWAAPVDQHMGWTRLCASPSAADYKYLGGSHEETIQKDQARHGTGGSPPFPLSSTSRSCI